MHLCRKGPEKSCSDNACLNLSNAAFPKGVILLCTTFCGTGFTMSTIVEDGAGEKALGGCLDPDYFSRKEGRQFVLEGKADNACKRNH